MADAMQGIMSLPEGQDTQQGSLDQESYNPAIEGYARANPQQFKRDILGGMAEADPQLVDGFIRQLAQIDLPSDVVQALQLMVDNILANPSNYKKDRAELIADGVPAEILPEEFDASYFAAFNIAIDQLALNIEEPAPAVPTFADGGIVNIKTIAKDIAAMGRGGDTMLAHITPQEARMLRERGGSGTINPDTGLPEFFFKFIKNVFKGVGKAISGVVKGIGSVVKSIASSTIGKIALTFAAVYFMGPAGLNLAGSAGSLTGVTSAVSSNIINTVAGSTLVNIASGQKIGDAIKGGIVSGALAGAGTAVFGGGVPGAKPVPTTANAFEKSMGLSKYSAPASVADDVITGSLDDAVSATKDVATPTSAGPSSVTAANPTPYTAQTYPLAPQAPIQGYPIGQAPGTTVGSTPGASGALEPFKMQSTSDYANKLLGAKATPVAGVAPSTGGISSLPTSIADDVVTGAGTSTSPGVMDLLKKGEISSAAKEIWKNISPSAIKDQGIKDALKSVKDKFPSATDDMIINAPSGSVLNKAYDAALPGIVAQYGPLLGVGTAAMGLLGGFGTIPSEMPPGFDGPTGPELLEANPSMYGLSFGGTKSTYSTRNPYESMYSKPTNPFKTAVSGGVPTPTMKMATGGVAEYPRKTGHIAGPGTGTSDSVPAMLSDGEFVFTAKAVRAMGNGSRRKGAKRMYAMMKDLERKVNG